MDAARLASTARVIDYSSDPDHNRMVVTLLGAPDEIRRAVLAAAEKAVESIDMRRHEGVHPRIGAVDVVPLVPVSGVTMGDCIDLSREIGRTIAESLNVPIFFYEESAVHSHRRNLADVRRGGYERLVEIGLEGDRAPDFGPRRVNLAAGATTVGARGPLVAFNVNLDADLEVARSIAKKIRGEGGVKSIGLWLASKSVAQVSMNLTKPDTTSMADVYRFVKAEADALGVEIVESELIGATLRRFMDGTTPQELKIRDFKESQIIDNWL